MNTSIKYDNENQMQEVSDIVDQWLEILINNDEQTIGINFGKLIGKLWVKLLRAKPEYANKCNLKSLA